MKEATLKSPAWLSTFGISKQHNAVMILIIKKKRIRRDTVIPSDTIQTGYAILEKGIGIDMLPCLLPC